jgi:ribosome recycling factor
MKLTKPETELIRDALRMLRESVRDQIRSAQTQKTITENLEKRLHCIFALDEKLSKNN